ncbi:phytoene desaturase family protein [Listeria grayi]|nr:phytoene desaturase family protein [Listeria grayi]
MTKVTIIGAGVAGLCAGIRLQKQGYQVTIYEKNDKPGGKMNQIKKNGFTFDLGPTIVMMPDIYREVFTMAGEDPDLYLDMQPLNPMYTVFFGEQYEEKYGVSSELSELMKMLEGISEEDAQGFLQYLQNIYKRYLTAKNHFILKSFNRFSDFYNPNTIRQGLKLKTFDTAEKSIGKYVKNERIRNMLSFQTLYIGISPYQGPSIYTMIPMIELLYGIWFIKGGMYTLVESLVAVYQKLGGELHCEANVEEIIVENKVAKGIRVNGSVIASDVVLSNADYPYTMKHLLNTTAAENQKRQKQVDKYEYSCSCFVIYLGLSHKVSTLNVHNFFFAEDLKTNLEAIFAGERAEDPSFYVYLASMLDAELAPEGKEGMYVLVPVPSLDKQDWTEADTKFYRDKVMTALKKVDGFATIEADIELEMYTTPLDFRDKFHAYNGACFGLKPTLKQSNHLRPQSKDKHIKNLYHAGSSTHPGAGVPIVMTSAKLAAEAIIADEGERR